MTATVYGSSDALVAVGYGVAGVILLTSVGASVAEHVRWRWRHREYRKRGRKAPFSHPDMS